jgi:outer membrane lipoprotein SlyB
MQVAAPFVLALLVAMGASPVLAQTESQYGRCVSYAEGQSGYSEPGANPAQNAPLKGAAAGAAGGAFLGGITGGNAGTGAAIGVAFGAIAGEIRRRDKASARQNQGKNFYNDYNACMSQPPR